MDIIMKTGFLEISHCIPFRQATINKGKALFDSKHVQQVQEIKMNGKSVITGLVIRQTSINAPPYRVQVEIDDSRCVSNVHCTCVTEALRRCKHIYALIHFINADRSCSKTSYEQEWGKPSASQLGKILYSKPFDLSDEYPVQLYNNDIVEFTLSPDDFKENHICSLRDMIVEGCKSEEERICQLILEISLEEKINSIEHACCIACIEHLMITSKEAEIYDCEISLSNNMQMFFNDLIYLDDESIVELCFSTKKQIASPEWFKARSLRISASRKAHAIKSRKYKDNVALAKELLTSKKVTNKSVEYGIKKEKLALEDYKKMQDVHVFNIGLFVSPVQPWLCASVDGVVIENECVVNIVEIKCPITCKTIKVFDPEIQQLNVGYLKNTNGELQLIESHQYYTQIQIQLYVTGLMVCDLFVWSPCGSVTVEVHRDDAFLEKIIPKLTEFYFSYYLQELYNDENECWK